MRFSTLAAVAAATVSSAVAQDFVLGFNVGATDDKGQVKTKDDFVKEFKTVHSLQGAPGNFTTVRLYSNIQGGTEQDPKPIEAFEAAIETGTKLMLGLWASGTNNVDGELKALSAAIKEHGSKLTDLVVAISVGSEDLYRVSEPGIRNKAGVGNGADSIVKFIKDTRSKLQGTALAKTPITHVDTWTAWVNSSNKAVIDNIDFVAVNAFPFYESELDNTIGNAGQLLSDALASTEAVANGKDVWITETGWAYSGPAFGKADSTVDNAGTYWKDVGCAIFGKRNVFWYTLRDANPANEVKFAISDNLSTTPRYNLSCDKDAKLPSPSSTDDGNNSTSPSGSAKPSGSVQPSGSSNGGSGNGGSGNGGGSATTSGPAESTQTGNAPGASSVSVVNSMAMALSVVFAFAAFAL